MSLFLPCMHNMCFTHLLLHTTTHSRKLRLRARHCKPSPEQNEQKLTTLDRTSSGTLTNHTLPKHQLHAPFYTRTPLRTPGGVLCHSSTHGKQIRDLLFTPRIRVTTLRVPRHSTRPPNRNHRSALFTMYDRYCRSDVLSALPIRWYVQHSGIFHAYS